MLVALTSFLSVLKIIGIVLLVILGVVLFILALVLFVPIIYKVDATVPEMDPELLLEPDCKFDTSGISLKAGFSWLWFVLRGEYSYPDAKQFTLKVFGIQLRPKKEKPGAKEDKEDSQQEQTGIEFKEDMGDDKEEGEEAAAETAAETKPGAGEEESTDAGESTASSENADAEGSAKEEDAQSTSDNESEEEKEPKSFLDFLWKIFDKIDSILKTPLSVFEKIRYTISRVCDKIEMIRTTIENDIFKRAFEETKKRLISIIRMSLPDKCDIRVLYGSSDPSVTAQVTGVYGALYPTLYKKVQLTPDFERSVFKTDAHIKGHITICVAVYSALMVYINKDIKKTIKRFKKIINS